MSGIINVIMAWLPTYLLSVKHFSVLKVGFVGSAPFVGAVLGNLVGGWFSDRVVAKRRKPTILISTVSTVFMMYALVQAPNEPVALAALTTTQAYPLAVSVVNTGGQAGGALLPFATGLILDRYSWNAVFLFLAACSLVALAIMLLVVEPVEEGHP